MKKSLIAFACTVCSSAFAYDPPGVVGWWQLQNPVTYAEVCTASDMNCDPEPGTYTLIDFGFNPARRTSVTVGSPSESTGVRFETMVRDCTYTDSCYVQCPAGMSAIAHSCDATVGKHYRQPDYHLTRGDDYTSCKVTDPDDIYDDDDDFNDDDDDYDDYDDYDDDDFTELSISVTALCTNAPHTVTVVK